MTTYDHQTLFDNAKHIIPGGVNSPVRAFNGVGGTPLFFSRAKGAYLYDVNNKPYIDYVGSWGPMILGHADPDVIRAVTSAAADGLSFGAPTIRETTMAQLMCRYIPSLEQVRMVNSGTEAVMSALRLARAYTNRSLVIKFAGCYHGHSDAMLVKAGSGALTLGVPTSPGVSADTARNTITLEYNDEAAAVACFARYGEDIAAVIIEPVAGNMGCVLPTDSFLPLMRALCDTNKSVLIFDEVMTGFRIARGGASEVYKAVPDMITLGKIIGGGMPVGAFGGKREIMQLLAPVGPVYQAGTLSGNPVAMAAGIATLQKVCQDGFHDDITYRCQRLVAGIREAAEAHDVPVVVNHCGGMFGLFFTDQPAVTNFTEVMQCDTERYAAFFHAMLAKGIYLAPSAFEAGFISITHDDSVIDQTVQAIDQVFGQLREQMLLAAAAEVQE